MARLYGNQIRNGIMTLDQIQIYWRAATEKWLADNPV